MVQRIQSQKMSRQSSKSARPSRRSLLALWFRNSETILVARLTALSGLILGTLTALDWSSFIGLDITNHKQFAFASGGLVLHGLVTELARRRPGSSDPV